jgi:hypothetical protein
MKQVAISISKKEIEAIDRALRYDSMEMEKEVVKVLEKILGKWEKENTE